MNTVKIVNKKFNVPVMLRDKQCMYDRFEYTYKNKNYSATVWNKNSYFMGGNIYVQRVSSYADSAKYYYAKSVGNSYAIYLNENKIKDTDITDVSEIIKVLENEFNSIVD